MQIKEIKKEVEAIKYIIEVDKKVWADALKEKQLSLAKSVQVEGFRKGHVPFEIAKKYISFGDLATRSLEPAIEKTREELENSDEFNKEDIELIETPTVDVLKVNEEELELSLTYDVFPTVTVRDYKKISLIKNEHETVSEEDIDKEINKYLRHQKKVIDKTEGSLEKGDIAIFDFEGFKDGVAFAGGTAKNYELEIGTNQFVPGFEDQMVGMNLGETRELEIIFPENYQEPSLAGQKTIFKVTLNGMKSQTIPAISEEFIKTQDIAGVATVEEFRAYVKKQLQAQYDLNYKDRANNDLIIDLVANTEVSHIPASMLNAEKRKIKTMLNNQLKQQGLDLEKYLKFINTTEEQFDMNLTKDAITSLKYALAVEQIIKQEEISVSDAEVEEYLEGVSKIYNVSVEDLKKQIKGNLEALKEQLLNDKVVKSLIEWNKANPVKEVKAEEHNHQH
ncbi:trigger factor [Ureaplasma ceti]|uniref:Trigger factor n=1 Tax=Ureaplasma ceti TaxID=3119530 RepID=A0ABP9U6P6_9BACT